LKAEIYCLKILEYKLDYDVPYDLLEMFSASGFIFDNEINNSTGGIVEIYNTTQQIMNNFLYNLKILRFSPLVLAVSCIIIAREYYELYDNNYLKSIIHYYNNNQELDCSNCINTIREELNEKNILVKQNVENKILIKEENNKIYTKDVYNKNIYYPKKEINENINTINNRNFLLNNKINSSILNSHTIKENNNNKQRHIRKNSNTLFNYNKTNNNIFNNNFNNINYIPRKVNYPKYYSNNSNYLNNSNYSNNSNYLNNSNYSNNSNTSIPHSNVSTAHNSTKHLSHVNIKSDEHNTIYPVIKNNPLKDFYKINLNIENKLKNDNNNNNNSFYKDFFVNRKGAYSSKTLSKINNGFDIKY
jgi:hypothetical protein